MLKHFMPLLAIPALIFSSCAKNEKPSETIDAEALAAASRSELEGAVSDRDQLLELVGDIQQNINEIKELENIVTASSNETPDRRQQIREDIAAIREALVQKQKRLAELEAKLSSSNLYSASLQKTIETLKNQIETQSAEIDRLNSELANANQRITQLDTKVDSLNTTVSNVTNERDAAQQESVELNNQLNTCYYAIGSAKELKQHKILEGGFLKKTKIMDGDFDASFFTTADKRTLTSIPLDAKKAEVLTNQPKNSYRFDRNGQSLILVITDPSLFWNKSNYLVVKIN